MILLSVHNSEGKVGACDARCYDALSPVCDCICNSRNHGVGRDQAIRNNQALIENGLDECLGEFAKSRALDPSTLTIHNPIDKKGLDGESL